MIHHKDINRTFIFTAYILKYIFSREYAEFLTTFASWIWCNVTFSKTKYQGFAITASKNSYVHYLFILTEVNTRIGSQLMYHPDPSRKNVS